MNKCLVALFLLLTSAQSYGIDTCLNVAGKYSIASMTCQGQWDTSYLVLNNEFLGGSFTQHDTIEIKQKQCESITITLTKNSNFPKQVTLPNYNGKKKIKMKFLEDRMEMKQGQMFKSFTASFELTGNGNLILVNEFRSGFNARDIMRECQLPRLSN